MKRETNNSRIAVLLALVLLGLAARAHAFYDPGVQRWLNRDPLGDNGSLVYQTAGIAPWEESDAGDLNDGEFLDFWTDINRNPYRAIGNDPVNVIDPLGLAELPCGGGPGAINPQNIAAADMRTAGEVLKAQVEARLKRSTLDALQKSKAFGNGLKGSRNIDVGKLKQALNRDQLQKAKEIAQEAVKVAKERLKQAATDKARQKELDFIETQLNRARACKQALAP